jgi:hypothetical protein
MMIDEAQLEEVGSGLAPWARGGSWSTRARRHGFANTIVYPHSETARARRAGVDSGTDDPSEAYTPFAPWRPGRAP